jgi:hypothetical protein
MFLQAKRDQILAYRTQDRTAASLKRDWLVSQQAQDAAFSALFYGRLKDFTLDAVQEAGRATQWAGVAIGVVNPVLGGLLGAIGGTASGSVSIYRGHYVEGILDIGFSVVPYAVGKIGRTIGSTGGRVGRQFLPNGSGVSSGALHILERRVATSFDVFIKDRTFTTLQEAEKAWEVYQQAANSTGLIIGHGDIPIQFATDGWHALRMLQKQWSVEVNKAWIHGAVDAGKPVRLVTPFADVIRGSVTWNEIEWVISRGGKLIAF